MEEVEKKNRALNDRINEIIYNKAAKYKEKTLEALRKNPETVSPRGRRERLAQFGIADHSERRLNQAIANEHMTTEKALDTMSRIVKQ